MEFKQLQSFVSVVQQKSFTKAAAELYISQPTISTHIYQLEEELHTKLILRTTKSISITPKGAEYGRLIHNRHRALRSFLEDLLEVDPETANEEACMIEHCISQETTERWISWMETCRGCQHRRES